MIEKIEDALKLVRSLPEEQKKVVTKYLDKLIVRVEEFNSLESVQEFYANSKQMDELSRMFEALQISP